MAPPESLQSENPSECPKSPSPTSDNFKIPADPEVKEYESIPPDKFEELKGEKDKATEDANLTKEKHKAVALKAKNTAEAAHKVAQSDFNTNKSLLEIGIKNSKSQYWREYKHALAADLPKNVPPSKENKIEDDGRVPMDKRALHIAELQEKLHQEDLKYTTESKELRKTWTVAENEWRVAKETYDLELCRIVAELDLAISTGNKAWRAKLSDELANIRK